MKSLSEKTEMKSERNEEVLELEEKERVRCPQCVNTFSTTHGLNRHYKLVHHGEKQFPCHICGKEYQTKPYLAIHMRIHTGEKPYFCENCGKSFSDPSSYKVHEMQHTYPNQSFSCTICGKYLKREKNLKLHMADHGLGREKSGRKIAFSNEFKVEAIKKVKEIGLKSTSELMNVPNTKLRNWVNVCKANNKCQLCDKIFPFKPTLEKHIKQKHSVGSDEKRHQLSNGRFDKTLKVEVVNFDEVHGRQAAIEKYKIGESTIRRWIQVSKDPIVCNICGRTCAYQKEHDRHMVEVHKAEDVEHPMAIKNQSSLKNFMEKAGENISFDQHFVSNSGYESLRSGLALQMPSQIAFLDQVIKEYGGIKLARILEKIKQIPENELNELIATGGYQHLCEDPKPDITEEEKVQNFKPTHKELLDFKFKLDKDQKFETNEKPDKTSIETNSSDSDIISKHEETEDATGNDSDESDEYEFESVDHFKRDIKNDRENDINSKEDEYVEESLNIEMVNNENQESSKDESELKPYISRTKTEKKCLLKESGKESKTFEISKSETEEISKEDTDVKSDISITETKKKNMNKNIPKQIKETSTCEKCGKAIKNDLKRHMLTHTSASFICIKCAKPFTLQHNLDRHMRTHDGLRPYSCNFCVKSYSQAGSLKDHEGSVHNGEKCHKCKMCDALFTNYMSLMRHNVKEHGADKPHSCAECGKGFLKKWGLLIHNKTHKGSTSCEQCLQSFVCKSGLRNHMDTHTHKFICKECGKAYSSKREKETHINVFHLGNNMYECNKCSQTFGRRGTLRVHYLSHTKDLKFKCEYCHLGFKEKRNLLKHIAKSHS